MTRVYDNRFGAPGDFDIARCNDCGQVQTQPRLTEAALIDTYQRHYNFGGGESAYTGFRNWLYLSAIYRLWLWLDGDITFQNSTGQGRLLDVGCNEGRGLEQFRRHGYDAEGLELNAVAAVRARARGFTVSTLPLAEFVAARPFDVVVLSNVLEHATDPRGMLRDIARLLHPGGELWISLPNAGSVWCRVFGRHWINWHVPYHIIHFDRASLTRLLVKAGFDVVDCRNESPALWIAQSFLAMIFAQRGQPTRALRVGVLLAPLLVLVRLLLFPILWYFNRTGRGDCLVLRARKI